MLDGEDGVRDLGIRVEGRASDLVNFQWLLLQGGESDYPNMSNVAF
jgi:hypothetical protein